MQQVQGTAHESLLRDTRLRTKGAVVSAPVPCFARLSIANLESLLDRQAAVAEAAEGVEKMVDLGRQVKVSTRCNKDARKHLSNKPSGWFSGGMYGGLGVGACTMFRRAMKTCVSCWGSRGKAAEDAQPIAVAKRPAFNLSQSADQWLCSLHQVMLTCILG